MDNYQREQVANKFLVPILAVVSGLFVAGFLILFTDVSPLRAYAEMFSAGFGCQELTRCALFTTFERATPLILTGLAAVVAFRSGMFSIGQEGQLMVGAVFGAWLGFAVDLPPVIHPIFVMAVAMLAGGIYGWIPGVMKVKLGVSEIISTIVLNDIAILTSVYLVNFPLRADRGTTAYSPVIDDTAKLMTFLPGSKWGIGFVIAITAALLVYLFLWRSRGGYEQRMVGESSIFALFGGIRNDRVAIRGMFISGALAGLAGAIEVLGVHYRINQDFSLNLGFDGLAVAILGQVHPFGAVLVAILFAGVRLGAQLGLQIAVGIPRELGGTIIALMILFVSASNLYADILDRGRKLLDRFRGRKSAVEVAVEERT
jgi:simple sugar transport system permease protein